MSMRAFTLLESLIYIALFGIIMTAAFESVVALTESADRNETKAFLASEGDFLIGKIDYAASEGEPVPLLQSLTPASVSSEKTVETMYGWQTTFTLSATSSSGQVLSATFSHESFSSL